MTVVRERAEPGARRLLRAFIGVSFAVFGLIASGCGNINYLYGTPVVTVSNVPGRFTTYIAYIDNFTLTAADGTVIEPQYTQERVDFTKLNNMSELLGAPAGIIGTFTSATITVDYTYAVIGVDINGKPTPVGSIVDVTGNPAGAQTYNITFDPAHPLVLTNGVSNAIDVNFDLTASTVVNTSSSPIQAVVTPFVTISTVPIESKPIRVRGGFVVANAVGTNIEPTASNFLVNTRPFYDEGSTLGAMTIQTNDQTIFYINGRVYVGAAGLTQLTQQVQENFNVASYGTLGSLAGRTPVFNATQVYAGTSLESPVADRVFGTISSRSGDNLNVHSALVFNRCGQIFYVPDLPLLVSGATGVTEDGSAATNLTPQSVSVGQMVNIAGQADPGCIQVSTSVDATGGSIRMIPTSAWGTLNAGATAGNATLSLASVGGFAPAELNFAGTGSSAATNANPSAYAVNTGTIDESATAVGTLLRADGFVNAFGAAPPDFNATAVTPDVSTDQQLLVDWVKPGATAPFASVNSTGLVVNMAVSTRNDGLVQTGPTSVSLTNPQVNVTIVPDPTVTGQFAIGNPTNGLFEFNSFAALVTRINSFLNGTNALQKLVAVGHYNPTTQTFTAFRIDMVQQ